MGWLSGWKYRKKITIDNTKIDSGLTDFPILVHLESGNFDFSKAESDFSDIRFTDSDGETLLKYEIEDTGAIASSIADIHVKVPSISSSADTDIYMYFGNSGASDAQDPDNVWDMNYTGIWHMTETLNGTPGELKDSTYLNNNGVGVSTIPVSSTGKIYKSLKGQGAVSYIDVADSDTLDLTGDFDFTWLMRWDGSVTQGSLFGKSDGGGLNDKWLIDYGAANPGQISWHSANHVSGVAQGFTWSPSADTWYHCRMTRSGTSLRFFVNGIQQDTTKSFTQTTPNTNRALCMFHEGEGWQYYSGHLDEVRLTNGATRSDAWIKAEYNSHFNTLISLGSLEYQIYTEDLPETVISTDSVEDFQYYFEGLSDVTGIADTLSEILTYVENLLNTVIFNDNLSETKNSIENLQETVIFLDTIADDIPSVAVITPIKIGIVKNTISINIKIS